MGSTRLPGKVLKKLDDFSTLDWVLWAASEAKLVDKVVIATSDKPADDEIHKWCTEQGISCFRGSETDVLDRFYGAAQQFGGDILVRLTGDCPFLDPRVIDEVIKLREMTNADYATNTNPPSYPDGLDVEVMTLRALRAAHEEATRPTDRDTVTRWIVRRSHHFHCVNLTCPLPDLHRERWVLDSPEDLEFIRQVIRRMPNSSSIPSYLDILAVLDKEPELRKINAKYERNERFYEALTHEIIKTPRSYEDSNNWLEAAERTIPLGAQTYSKSKLAFPAGSSPLFLSHGDGGYAFDVDGNDYVDLVGALLPNILGYRDPDVDAAIRAQLNKGISFSLATPQELILSRLLNRLIPSAEMVRFGKNGSDVTSAAVRLARHITGRDKIYVKGYHGWHDWSIANDPIRNNGVPKAVRDLTSISIDSHAHEWAAAIIEPEFCDKAELQNWRNYADEKGFILIFDEIISGFRFGLGGLQKVHSVIPDLSTFGKSMANGMPISALVGKEKYMKRMTEISYSGTFFGEALSIAAAIATISKLERENVPQYLDDIGLQIWFEVNRLRAKHDVMHLIYVHGHSALPRIGFGSKHIQSLFIQEMARRGVLIAGSMNFCYAHKPPQLQHILKAWDGALEAIKSGVELYGKPIEGEAVR
jgi:glutamate-1-semialdehyde 2,1-aminomutase/spore coat polysaccharide biosynthesis protein SpsF